MTLYVTSKPGIGAGAPAAGKDVGQPHTEPRAAWTGREKADLVAALRDGLISEQTARDVYGLTPEEIAAWERTLDSLRMRARR